MSVTERGVVLLVLAVGFLAAEPSVYGQSFGSGNAQVSRNKKMIYSLRQEISRMQEEIDGLRSVVEGLNQQLNQLRRQKKSAADAVTPEQLNRLEQRIAALEKRPAEVTKKSAPAKKNASKSAVKTSTSPKTTKTGTGSGDSYLRKAASNKLFSRGVRLINQKRYTEAKKRFEILEGRGYKSDSTQFYLGEIAYRTGKYDDAIRHYQKSAELNENAAYMDRLLLHTGIALEKSGDKEQARNFFQAIVDGYPGTASARVAKKHLK